MDFLATPRRKRLLFATLYFSEGAPIGFLWLALPTRLKAIGIPLDQITSLASLLVIPWTVKFAWAPVVDVLRGERWSLRHWIVTSQALMAGSLLPLFWWDPRTHLGWLSVSLFFHAIFAATQDVAIDSMCISETTCDERGRFNGWMQAGMLLGRSCFGGGALLLSAWFGDRFVVAFLILAIMSSSFFVVFSRERLRGDVLESQGFEPTWTAVGSAIRSCGTWAGLLFGLLGGAASKSLEVIYGPYLVERGFDESEIGWFAAGPMVVSMLAGSLGGGFLADRIGRRRFVAVALLITTSMILGLAWTDATRGERSHFHLELWLVATAFGIGMFTVASYALFMDLTDPTIGASQFTAFMGATNGCEVWSTLAIGQLIAAYGYPMSFVAMSCVSLLALLLLPYMVAGSTASKPLE